MGGQVFEVKLASRRLSAYWTDRRSHGAADLERAEWGTTELRCGVRPHHLARIPAHSVHCRCCGRHDESHVKSRSDGSISTRWSGHEGRVKTSQHLVDTLFRSHTGDMQLVNSLPRSSMLRSRASRHKSDASTNKSPRFGNCKTATAPPAHRNRRTQPRRKMSAATRKRMGEAQRKRWAATKGDAETYIQGYGQAQTQTECRR